MQTNPAITALVAIFDNEIIFGQVRIKRSEKEFVLSHAADAGADSLRALTESELQALAQFTEAGAFRPLKSAPTLRHGWRFTATGAEQLNAALNILYPGAVADWFAAQSAAPPVTSYRDFTERQTGMYRITATLDDTTAGAVIRACCHKDFCLKRRLWTVSGLAPDIAGEKGLIPCLEPCAILLEFARKMARLEKEGRLATAPINPDFTAPETDFDNPCNPRRARFVLEKAAARTT